MVAGDRVGLHLRNHAEHVEAMLGVFKARAVPVNVNFRYTAEELAYLVTDSAMAALFTEPDLAPVAREAARLADRPDLVIVERGAAYDALLAGAAAARPAVGERTGDDLYLLYTGGTTGAAQGRDVAPARHLHGQLRWPGHARTAASRRWPSRSRSCAAPSPARRCCAASRCAR